MAERFGRLTPHRVRRTRDPKYPALIRMGVNTKKPDGKVDKVVFACGQGWHTDGPWEVRGVSKATQLYGLELPSVGVDTWFANMYASLDALPEALRQRLEGVQAEYVCGGRERLGMDEDEGNALFDELRGRMIQPDAEYHHQWRKHDFVIWDNRCSNHAAAGGYPVEERRVHWRVTILE